MSLTIYFLRMVIHLSVAALFLLLTPLGAANAQSGDGSAQVIGPTGASVSTSHWQRTIGFGASGNEGNTTRSVLKLSFQAERIDGWNEWRIAMEGIYDEFADIDYRVLAGPGIGRYLVKSPRLRVSVEVGSLYVWEKLAGTRVLGGGDVDLLLFESSFLLPMPKCPRLPRYPTP